MTTLTVKEMDFGYTKNISILKDIDIEMCNPQLISIIGPNGAGKTTLIHCLNKLLSPSKGTVLIDDTDVSTIKPKELAKKMGYVPYTSGDSFPLSVVDTVLMGRNPHRKWNTLSEDMKVVEEALDMMDITDLAMRPFNELSAGQHQRVMLARGLAQEPEVLLLDEPTANLDIKHQMDVIRLLKKQSTAKGIMVVMISHDLNIAAKYSDNVILMSEGRIYAVGTPRDVITTENMRAVYGVDVDLLDIDGRPHIVIQDYDFSEEDSRTPEGSYVVSDQRQTREEDRRQPSRAAVRRAHQTEGPVHTRVPGSHNRSGRIRPDRQQPRPEHLRMLRIHLRPRPRKRVHVPIRGVVQ